MPSLRYRKNGHTYPLRIVPSGNEQSNMGGTPRVKVNGQIYNLSLVETGASTASPVRVKTRYGVKAIQKGPWTIKASVNGDGGSISANGTVISTTGILYAEEGSTPSVTITADPCYHIDNIVIDSGTPIQPTSSPNVYTFNPIQGDHTIVATFGLGSTDHYPISLMSGSGGNITMSVDGTNRTVGSGSVVACVTANEPHSFYAQTNASGYGGTAVHFSQWQLLDANLQSLGTSTDNPMIYTPTGVTYLTAMYLANTVSTYSLSGSVSSGGGTIIPSTAVEIESGRSAKVLIKPDSGYRLTGLTRNGNSEIANVSNNVYTINSINTPTTMVATFSPQYTITASAGLGGSISPSITVADGETPNFTVNTYAACYQIHSIIIDGTTHLPLDPSLTQYTYTFPAVHANHTIAATFSTSFGSSNTPVHLMSQPGNSTITVDGANYNASTSNTLVTCQNSYQLHTFSAPPTISYGGATIPFYRWEINQWMSGSTFYRNSNPMVWQANTPTVITAQYQSGGYPTYTINASANPGGTITPSGTVTCNGGIATFYAKANSGYHLTDLRLNDVSVKDSTYNSNDYKVYTINDVNCNGSLVASFANQYVINTSSNTGGSISPEGQVYVPTGSNKTFTMTQVPGYNIAHVYVDGVDQGAIPRYTFYNVMTDHTIVAAFEREYAISLSYDWDFGSITTSLTSLMVLNGATPSFTITAGTNFHISDIAISGNGNTTHIQPGGTSYIYTFPPITSDVNLAVTFSPPPGYTPIMLETNLITDQVRMNVDGTLYNANSGQPICLQSNQSHSICTNSEMTIDGVNCYFQYWMTDGNSVSYSNPLTCTLTGNKRGFLAIYYTDEY